MEHGRGELPFIAVLIGVLIGCGIIIGFTKIRFQQILEKTDIVIPEER